MLILPMAANSLLLAALALASMSALSSFASAQSSSCSSAAMSLAPCLTYVTGSASTPSLACCAQLSALVQSQPQCLCSLIDGGTSSSGITLNQTRALALPGACNVQTPQVSSCNATAGGPAKSPSASPPAPKTPDTPAPESPSSPESPPATEAPRSSPPATPSTTPPSVPATGGGSRNSTAGQDSGGSADVYSSRSLLVAVFSAAAAAAFLCQYISF